MEDNQLERITQLERKVSVLNRLAEISAVLNSTLELEALMGYLMDAAAAITDSEAASVLLWDDKTRELKFTATTTRQSGLNLIGQSVPLDSIAGTILTENRIVVVENAADDPRHYKETDEETQFSTRSLMGVPMTIRDRVVGVLEVLNKRSHPWLEEDRDYLSVLAAQAAVAIEGAQMVAALQKANKELSEVDKLKNDFIAIASHELRTPLAIILGYASFLQEEAEGKLSEHAAKVLASGLQLRHIIEDLMNLRYLQQNSTELQIESVTMKDLLDDSVQEILNLAEAKKHQLRLDVPQDVVLKVDRIRAGMAISNVLHNAVRFTPEGGSITVTAEERNGEAWVKVSDTGIGLENEQLERVFEKFYQAQDHMTRTHGGLGIGLSIARALAEAHGGRIWAESPGLGQGSVFTLTLPLEAPSA